MITINTKEFGVEFIYDLLIELLKNPLVTSAEYLEKESAIKINHLDSEIALRKDIDHLILTKNICQN